MSRLTKLIEACKYRDLEIQANNPDGKYLRIEIWGKNLGKRFFKGIKHAEIFIDGFEASYDIANTKHNDLQLPLKGERK